MMPRQIAVRAAGVVLLGLGLTAPILVVASAPARADINFSGSASANAVRMVVHASGAPVSQDPVDGGGPVAQAALDSNDSSQAFASFPYPGDLALSGPALLPGLMAPYLAPYGLEFPALPAYPLAVSSDWPSDSHAGTVQGPIKLDAASNATASTGTASIAPPGPASRGATATANVSHTDGGSVIATSTSGLHGFTLGALTFADLRSTARVEYTAAGKLTRSSDLSVTGLSVAGLPVDVRPGGLFVNGQAFDSSAAADVLKAAGITLAFLPEEKTRDGVIGAALAVRRDQEFGSAGTGYVSYIFGQTSAQVAGSVVADVAGGTGKTVAPTGATAGFDEAAGNAGLPASGMTGAADLAGSPGVGAVVAGTSAVPATALAPVTSAAQAAGLEPERAELGGLYAVLALAVAVGILAAQLVRRLGVRSS
jgi:hypothetical protein